MKRVGASLLCVLTLAGCRGPGEVVDPFLGRMTVEPPRTGSVSGQRPEPYYNPGRAVAVANPAPVTNPIYNSALASRSAPVSTAVTTPARIVTAPPPLWISDRPRKVRTNELAARSAPAPAATWQPPSVVCVPQTTLPPVVCQPAAPVVCVPQTNLFAAPSLPAAGQASGQVCVPLARTINIADLPQPAPQTAAGAATTAR